MPGRACKVLLAACLGTCIAQGAGAADFVFPVTPSPTGNPNWAGFYLENRGGDAARNGYLTNIVPTNGFSVPAQSEATNESFGYNFQSGSFVFGLEGSLAAANFDGKFTSPYLPAAGGWSPNMNWLGTVTGRVGYSFGQWLPYVKGGFAAADVGSHENGLLGFSQSTSERAGWTAGVGLEYQLTTKWSLGLEYLYTDLDAGAPQSNAPPVSSGPEVYSTAVKTQSLIGRLNYKAGW